MIVIYAVDQRAYVKFCDVDAMGGQGAVWFGDRAQAIRFVTVAEALEYWKRQSTVVPLRADGKPNRPLSALTVMFQRVEE